MRVRYLLLPSIVIPAASMSCPVDFPEPFGYHGRMIGLRPSMIHYIENTAEIYRRGVICSHVGLMAPGMTHYNKYSQLASMLLDRFWAYEEQRKRDASPLLRVRA